MVLLLFKLFQDIFVPPTKNAACVQFLKDGGLGQSEPDFNLTLTF